MTQSGNVWIHPRNTDISVKTVDTPDLCRNTDIVVQEF